MNEFSVLNTYGEDLTNKTYITNPAIARETEIRKMMVVLLTPDKSALLIGKPGIGKTAVVEGLAYEIINNTVPDALKGYRIIKINSFFCLNPSFTIWIGPQTHTPLESFSSLRCFVASPISSSAPSSLINASIASTQDRTASFLARSSLLLSSN